MLNKILVNIFALILVLLAISGLQAQQPDNDELYKNSFRPDIPRSMQDIPYEDKDYKGKMYSPYVLVSIPRTVSFNREKIDPGFYLVKPFSENNVDYLIFKKKDFALALVPVAEKSELPKKVKKMQAEIIEDAHGQYMLLMVKYQRSSYIVKLDVVK